MKSNHRLYAVWNTMRHRCDTPSHISYHNYGAKGVRVCDRWQSFENFLEDMESSYQEGLTIDRINPAGNYEPSNCKWSTRISQNNNRCNNVVIKYNGVTKTMSQWADSLGIKYGTLYRRIVVKKWDIETAFNHALWSRR